MFSDKSFTTLTRMEEVTSENGISDAFVLKLLKIIMVLSFMNVLILERNLLSVTFVRKHLRKKVLLPNIKELILVKSHLNVIFVERNFHSQVI